jgi:hypothetical protein
VLRLEFPDETTRLNVGALVDARSLHAIGDRANSLPFDLRSTTMTRSFWTFAITICVVSVAVPGEAALFSSNKAFNNPVENSFHIVSNPSCCAGGTSYNEVGKLRVGVTSAAVTVDTTADTGVIDSFALTPFSVTPTSFGASYAATFTIVTGNFPDPPVTQTISGTWTETITIDSVTGASPTFDSSVAQPISVIPEAPPWYSMHHPDVFNATPFTLSGTYKMVGPMSMTSIPWSMTFEPNGGGFASIGIKGTSSLGNGFEFKPLFSGQGYIPDDPVIFQGTVDGLTFTVQMANSINSIYFSKNSAIVPEPAAIIAATMAALSMAATRRRGGST